ncbi:RNA-guided endonuclease InsQ/TnpB family protein [Ewingella americana]|uniref:Transposase n=1 Tax=Ewingella americana TaxID=41202 RepID=A0A502GDP6_9GAMM|nr:RNA-guided endonuclease TnpB family protein [Ewingella americana]TPG60035.1 transposase [Ewingella americana]
MNKTYRYKLFPRKDQLEKLSQAAGCCRFVYNEALAYRKEQYDLGTNISGFDLIKRLPQLKVVHPWLSEAPATSLQKSVADLDIAYRHFFRRVKQRQTPGFPKFKSKHDQKQSFNLKWDNISSSSATYFGCIWRNKQSNWIRLAKMGWFRLEMHRDLPENAIIKSATVKRDIDGWYISFLLELPELESQPCFEDAVKNSIGIDFGLKSFLTLSNGDEIKSPRHYHKAEKKLKRYQRSMSRKTKGSKNRLKAKQRVAKLHLKIRNQRKDYLRKLAFNLANSYSLITIEDLTIQNMSKNHCLAKSIMTSGWAMFAEFLAEKCLEADSHLIKADRWFASSKIIFDTGEYLPLLQLKHRWLIDCNGAKIHRDINAARNLNYWGQHLISTGEKLSTQAYLKLYH